MYIKQQGPDMYTLILSDSLEQSSLD